MKRKFRYLNTDLELIAPHDLTLLTDALAQQGVLLLHSEELEEGTWSARFETAEPFVSPDQNIAAMLTAIEALDEASKTRWMSCTARAFDLGYDCGDEPFGFNHEISTEIIGRIAAASMSIQITLYPAEALSSDSGAQVSPPK